MMSCAVLLLCSLLVVSSSLLLRHDSSASFSCPGSVVSCECSEAFGSLGWVVLLNGMEMRITYDSQSNLGQPESRMISSVSVTSILLSKDTNRFASAINISLGHKNVNVRCESLTERRNVTIHVTCKFHL